MSQPFSLQRTIVVVPYDPVWPRRFAEEAERIRTTLGEVAIDVQHIGSTSVPGLAAKPVIDLLLLVRDLPELDAHTAAMEALGYEARGEFGIAGRRFFAKGGNEHRSHHVHAFEPGHAAAKRHLAFRDYLCVHPAEAERYAALKLHLASQHRHDIEAYMEGKAPLILELLGRAEAWAGKKS